LGLVNFPGNDIKRGKRSKSLRELSCYSGTSKGTDIDKHKFSQSALLGFEVALTDIMVGGGRQP